MERIVPEAAERFFLLNAGSEEVYRYLRKHTKSPPIFGHTLADEIQQDLLVRNEPIIDLALAQFGDCEEVINEILAKDNRDLRIAVLANSHRLRSFALLRDLKTGLLPDEVFDQLLSSGDSDELLAFFGNPRLDKDVLTQVFAREGKYADLPDERWMVMVIAALRNPQLHEERGIGDFVDGWDHYRHGRPFAEIYKLLLRIEPSVQWAANLYPEILKLADWSPDTEGAMANLGDEMPDPLSGNNGELISKEWRESNKRGEELYLKQVLKHWKTPEDESRDLRYGASHDLMREAIVSRLPGYSHLIDKMFTYNDVWIRRGAYRVFRPSSPEEMDRFYERDGLHFLEAAINNPNFFRNTSDSAAAISLKLHDLVMYGKRKPEDDTDTDFTRNYYHGQLKRLHESDPSVYPINPEAFERPDASEVADVDPAQAASENLERMRSEISDLSRNMRDQEGFKELSGMVNRLSDMVAKQSQVSQNAITALEKRLLARSHNERQAVVDGVRYFSYFCIIVLLAWFAIDFIKDFF